MSTPHNAAAAGDFAKTVLMPGDPLRAKFIAETFLESPGLVTSVRGMLGYTGTYKGVPVSVMGSGMGMPSIGIYSWELFTQYGVENIIRIGSAGSYSPQAKVFDVVLATSAYSESSYAKTQNGYDKDVTYPSEALCGALRKSAARLGMHFSNNPAVNRRAFQRRVLPRRRAGLLGKAAGRKGLSCRRDGELCAVPQCGRHEKKRRVPAHNFRQLCIP